MPEKQSDVVNRMQQLAAESSAQQVRLLQQYVDLYQKFLNNETTAIDPATAAHFWLNEGSSYAQRVAELNLRVYNELFDMSRGLAERYLKLVGSSGGAKKAAAAPQPSAPSAAARKTHTVRRTPAKKK